MTGSLDDPNKTWLISYVTLDSSPDGESTARNIDTCLEKLKLDPKRLYLLLSDVAGYMKKFGAI